MFKTYCKVEALPYLWHLFAQIIHDVQDTAKAQVHNILSDLLHPSEMNYE